MTYEEAKEEIERMLYGDGPRVLPKRTGEAVTMREAAKFWWDDFKKRYEAGRADHMRED